MKVQSSQNAQKMLLIAIFVMLGAQVGVWAFLLKDLVDALDMSSSQLGFALMVQAIAGFLGLILGGRIADKIGRKPIALLGIGGTGVFFISLQFLNDFIGTLVAFFAGGIFLSWYDLIANTLGGDYENQYSTQILTKLHAGFSGGAAAAALASGWLLSQGVMYTLIYDWIGFVLLILAWFARFLPFSVKSGNTETMEKDEETNHPQLGFKRGLSVVLFSSLLIALCFFIDGALEGFLSLYLRGFLNSGSLLGGIGIASLHASAMIGRLTSARIIEKAGESRVLIFSGLMASASLAVVIFTSKPVVAAVGLLGVGMSLSPIAPISFSLASRVAPTWGAQAVSIATGAGYLSFIVGPVIIGNVAEIKSLRTSLSLLLVSSAFISLLSVLWNVRIAIKKQAASSGSHPES